MKIKQCMAHWVPLRPDAFLRSRLSIGEHRLRVMRRGVSMQLIISFECSVLSGLHFCSVGLAGQ